MTTLRVVAVDDHKLVLEGIKAALEQVEGIDLVGVANSGSEALPLVARTNPDVILLDLRMPRMDGMTMLGAFAEPSSRRQGRDGVGSRGPGSDESHASARRKLVRC